MKQHHIIWIGDDGDLHSHSFCSERNAYAYAETLTCKFAYILGNVTSIDLQN